jgi:hypothetical protein
LRQAAQSQKLPVPERPESYNHGDDAEMDLGDREMEVDYMNYGAEYVLPNLEHPI